MSNFNINNVTFFRGHTVVNGQVDISESEYADYIDECYPTVEVAGLTFNASRIIQECDPVAFRCGLGDYESEIQSELEEAIDNEDDSDIDWEDGKSPDELDALEEQE
jgi:hypothetical protein